MQLMNDLLPNAVLPAGKLFLLVSVDDHRLPAASHRKDNSSKVNVSDKMTRRQRNYAQCYVSIPL